MPTANKKARIVREISDNVTQTGTLTFTSKRLGSALACSSSAAKPE
jgi:hypothetical protein